MGIQVDLLTAVSTGKQLFSSQIAPINGSNRVKQIKVQPQVKPKAKVQANRAVAKRENQMSSNTLDVLGGPSKARSSGRSVFLNVNAKGKGVA